MKTRLLALALLAATASQAAHAADARLTQRLYNANEVVRIDGKMGVQATVAFADDEHIENVAVGDAESWQITPNKRANLLFVKPLTATARTNMTVVTDRHTYYFDLIANPRATAPVYALKFTYPAEPKAAGAAGAPAVALTDDEREALDAQPVDPAQLNFAWASKGPARLIPQRLYDDGESTYAVWPKDVPIPAILVTNEKGDEGPVNFGVRGDTIVIDGVPKQLVLRVGRERAQLDYKGPGPKPKAQPQVQTASNASVQGGQP
ncbi:TrbG/VirB9 family P-type conjugative transfer protein [Novosphingobium sp. JCM 18896]|uniref:TrbG/VirB9 family P-type conjugative transfer protein n=1 Tax=Novosphingobium sp. JCM 18896 TaxID=2989731 RepID=UPI002223AB4F|nr:TrbG/VirB9 family P-type conjugative transfer protein [Novosphingobium sp. JCM 18896]MCW1429076.1 TrbG/VirB9 family P-type conjugative transfer protein [Novosphingobium sp. JCM 18896]